MIVMDLIKWLSELPQGEEVKYQDMPHSQIILLVHDEEDPKDPYQSDTIGRA